MQHFRASIKIYLVDAITNRKLGFSRISLFSVMQAIADGKVPNSITGEQIILKDMNEKENIGYLIAVVKFEEDLEKLFLSNKPITAPDGHPEHISVERLSIHIARFTALIDLINLCFEEYLYIMNWSDPIFTSIIFASFLYCVIKIKADYALSGLLFFVFALMTRTLIRRKFGQYKKYYIEKGIKSITQEYKPVASIKVSVLGYFDSDEISDSNRIKPTIKLSYIPMLESDDPNYNNNYNEFENNGKIHDNDNKFVASKVTSKEYTVGFFGAIPKAAVFSIPDLKIQGVSQLVSNIVGSESNQKDILLQNINDFWPVDSACSGLIESIKTKYDQFHLNDNADICLVYPVLQPNLFRVKLSPTMFFSDAKCISGDENHSTPKKVVQLHSIEKTSIEIKPQSPHLKAEQNHQKNSFSFLPWEKNCASLKFTIVNENASNFIDNHVDEFVKFQIKDLFTEDSNYEIFKHDINSLEICKKFPITSSSSDANNFKVSIVEIYIFKN
jgi:hypothetical protein